MPQLRLDAGGSSGNAGRPLSYEWTMVESAYLTKLRPAEYTPIHQHLLGQTESSLRVPGSLLPSGRTFAFRLTATNWGSWNAGSCTSSVSGQRSEHQPNTVALIPVAHTTLSR